MNLNKETKIAIVGIGGVFPGSSNLDIFWENIVNARDTSVEVDASRWRLEQHDLYSSELSPDKVNSRRACLIKDFQFDATGFEVAPDCLVKLDPMYQILLKAGRDAWLDSNTDKLNKQKVGVIIGNIALPTESSSQYSDEIFRSLFEEQLFNEEINKETDAFNRYVAGLPGGLLAKALGLGAGSYTLDAACASSLYSLKYAVDELLSGRADAMLAGGLSRPDPLYTQMGFSQLGAVSKSGRCSPFDHKADGLVVGEGAGIVVLKRLEDAIAQGDHVYATIAGIGLSNDIEGNIMSPDSEGQLRAMQAAYAKAGWEPNDVQHIECHGTGTPVGDGVEFNSLNELWRQHNADGECVIGSVKSNVGHLLTAAGSAALIKTLLAMKHGLLPPTANFEKPSDKLNLSQSPFTVLKEASPWHVNNKPRRAAISGFGFGGINAHVLLEEYQEQKIEPVATHHLFDGKYQDIAIVGMDMQLGPWVEANDVNEAMLFNKRQTKSQANHWWGKNNHQTGHYIQELNIPLGRYRIPPSELKEMLPQQLLMLEVAANALDDAGLTELNPQQQLRCGVYIGIELDMNTTNFHFRWMQKKYAREWLDRLGVELNNDELDAWIDNLRLACGPALNANRTMGALGGIVASRIARAFKVGGPAFTVSAEETSGLLALESGMRALQQHELDQVIIGAVDFAGDCRAALAHSDKRKLECVADGAIAFVLKRYDDAVKAGDNIYARIKGIGSASGGGCDDIVTSEVAQVNAIQQTCTDAGCHLDSVDQLIFANDDHALSLPVLENIQKTKFPLGNTGAANGLMAIGFAVSCLQHRLLPMDDKNKTRYWLKNKQSGLRRNLVNATSLGGNAMSVLLEEADAAPISIQGKTRLYCFAADSEEDLIANIQLRQFLEIDANDYQQAKLKAAFLADNEIVFENCRSKLINAIKQNKSINIDNCYYSVNPLYPEHKLAFVYPGSGNHYFGMGLDLGVAFPDVLEKLNAENEQLASQFAHGRFWQQDDGQPLSNEEVIFGQVWLGIFVSDVVSHFAIKPDAIIGYSLGETAGFFSTRTWKARDEMLSRIKNSTLFTEELAGPCRSVQKAWQTESDIDWSLGVINISAEKLKPIIDKHSRVYLLIINTPNECVIGGDRQQLQEVVKTLAVPFHPLSGVTTVHCEVAKPVQQAYRDLHLFETTPPADITFYSGIRGGAYEVNRESAADSILDQALAPFDYTKVINQAYADGVRLFIEMGPGGSCTRMIDQILCEREHIANAICVKGQNSVNNLLQILASLYVEGVPLDLSVLEQKKKTKKTYSNYLSIKVGGEAFNVPKPPIREKATKLHEVPRVKHVETANQQTIQLPMAVNSDMSEIIEQMQKTEQARAEVQETFLRVTQGMTDTLAQALSMQLQTLNGNIDSSQFISKNKNTYAILQNRKVIHACSIEKLVWNSL